MKLVCECGERNSFVVTYQPLVLQNEVRADSSDVDDASGAAQLMNAAIALGERQGLEGKVGCGQHGMTGAPFGSEQGGVAVRVVGEVDGHHVEHEFQELHGGHAICSGHKGSAPHCTELLQHHELAL